ncbi:MAG: RcnB family protein [Sphingomonas sp.]
MRSMVFAAVAASLLVPSIASAQSAREVRRDQREVRKDIRHGNYREAREDRREMREDWRDYRRAHRNVYHRPAYVGPRGWRYRPVTVGYRFAPAYYGRNYWVNDWQTYRLPRPGAHQRWVRYGNDVVLVNTRTGRVIAVNNGFFW